MIISLVVPAFASTDETASSPEVKIVGEKESGLEDVLKTVRRKFDIPEGAKFENYSVRDRDGEKIWYLNWRNSEKDVNISIDVTQSGKIINYYHYEPYDYSGMRLPKVTEEEALNIAKTFIRFIAPEGTLMEIEKQDRYQNPLSDYHYYFDFYRSVNGVPYYNNNIYITVNSETGKVTNYRYNMEDNLIFPDPKQAISLADGEKAYSEQLGLKLIYQYNYDYKKKELNIYPAYVPKYSNSRYAIDAITGEKIQITYPYIGTTFYDVAQDTAMIEESLKMAAGGMGEPVLTPEELEAVKKQSNLLSEKDAEKIVRDTAAIGLDEDFKLRSWNLNKNWPMQDEYVYYLNFIKEVEGETETSMSGEKAAVAAAAGINIGNYKKTIYASASINAETGEILSFSNNALNNTDPEKEPEFDEEEAKAAVEEFLKSFAGEKFNQVEYQEPEEDYIIYRTITETEPPKYFSFSYVRKVNDIFFPGNSINVGFDAVSGKVSSFSMTWFDADFPEIENVIAPDEADKALFEKICLELQYKKIERPDDYPIPLPEPKEVSVTEAKAEVAKAAASDAIVTDATDVAAEIVEIDTVAASDAVTDVAADATDDIAADADAISQAAGMDSKIYLSPEQIEKDKAEMKLVYVLKSGKPFILDAYTGDVLGNDGKPYKEDKPAEYTDLDGHFAEKQVTLLAKYRIINFEGPEFKPSEKVTQKDFLVILSKIIDRYYIPYIAEDSTQEEIDEMYKQLIRRGIVNESEKAPDVVITREDAVKFVIRALDYGKVADIPNIFVVPFEDAEDIATELKGYIAIASGLEIVSGTGGKFYPKRELTRAETAVMIYNCLNSN